MQDLGSFISCVLYIGFCFKDMELLLQVRNSGDGFPVDFTYH